jgi:hypothetical protein
MAKIYISSTYKDLREHRAAVHQQLRDMQHTVRAMEDYVARDDRPADACIRDVRSSELYVGILAWRYGYVPSYPGAPGTSITEMEYDAAIAAKIPRLMFLLDETAAWVPGLLDSATGENEAGQRIRAFRGRVATDRLASSFTSPDDLAKKVAAAVHLAGTTSQASDAGLDLNRIVGEDLLERPEILFSASFVPNLIQQIAELGDAQLLKIDLRDGKHWWSTRLYTLATLVHEYTSVGWLLFLERGNNYVGMVRPANLRRALAQARPELEIEYRAAVTPPQPGSAPALDAGMVLQSTVTRFEQRPGGEEALKFLVDASWLRANVPGLNETRVERTGSFDPLATWELLNASTPFVPVTDGTQLLKVVDRTGVAVEIARTAVGRLVGR